MSEETEFAKMTSSHWGPGKAAAGLPSKTEGFPGEQRETPGEGACAHPVPAGCQAEPDTAACILSLSPGGCHRSSVPTVQMRKQRLREDQGLPRRLAELRLSELQAHTLLLFIAGGEVFTIFFTLTSNLWSPPSPKHS